MTTVKDMNMAIDMLSTFGHLPHYQGQNIWLTDEQTVLLKNLGISFSKNHVKKWVPDDEWD